MTDRLARTLAAAALGVSFMALVLAGYAVWMGKRYSDGMQVLGEQISQALRVGQPSTTQIPMRPPPPQLEENDE
ncbi:MAG: hypothetical protein IPK60_03100 [Sandaracinaceae bacterium]|nr:hypothetical protein [Sandaracinaceae bacterium]